MIARRGGVFERLFYAHPWHATRVGPIDAWPLTLRRYASFILKLPTPAIIFWGPDHLQIYNAGYAVIMGPRHPAYLGAMYGECWPDTYPTIHPWMDRVLQGEVVEVENALFTLTRHGFSEETYFTFSFSPLLDDTIPDVLATNPNDIPFSLFYLWSEAEERLVLSGQSHFHAPPAPPAEVRLAFADNVPQVIERSLPERALALPVRRTASEPPRGVIVLGISPRLKFDHAYEEFFDAVAREISGGLAAEQERIALLSAERERQNLYDFLMQTPAPIAVLLGPRHRFLLANRSYIEFVGGRDVVSKDVCDAFEPGTVDSFTPEDCDSTVPRRISPWWRRTFSTASSRSSRRRVAG